MNLSEIIISACVFLIGILLSVAAYFITKWIATVDDSIKEISQELKDSSVQMFALSNKISNQSEVISKAVEVKLLNIKLPDHKFHDIRNDVTNIKNNINEKILPQIEKQTESFGRVIVLEERMQSQESKLISLFSVLKVLSEKLQK